jgi:hypothetical protein
MDTLHEDVSTFMTISYGIVLRMRNVSDKSCRENHNTFYVQYFFFFENQDFFEIMPKSVVEQERPHMTI